MMNGRGSRRCLALRAGRFARFPLVFSCTPCRSVCLQSRATKARAKAVACVLIFHGAMVYWLRLPVPDAISFYLLVLIVAAIYCAAALADPGFLAESCSGTLAAGFRSRAERANAGTIDTPELDLLDDNYSEAPYWTTGNGNGERGERGERETEQSCPQRQVHGFAAEPLFASKPSAAETGNGARMPPEGTGKSTSRSEVSLTNERGPIAGSGSSSEKLVHHDPPEVDEDHVNIEVAEGGCQMMKSAPLEMRGGTLRLRFCPECKIHQPLRTKHCRDCGRCVRTHDHHCPWLGNCVGEGNRCLFFVFILLQLVEVGVAISYVVSGVELQCAFAAVPPTSKGGSKRCTERAGCTK